MLKFIWNSWWRNKERFILLMVGMLIVSTGLSYLLGVTQANNGTVVNELQKRWDSSYHIVVRPEGSRSVTEDLNLLEPNYMSGLEGGITREQYETIQQIADIDVAAPIAMIGSTYSSSFTQTHTFDKAGLYRLKMNTLIDTGIEKINDFQDLKAYFWVGWMPNGDSTHIGIGPTALYEEFPLSYGSDVMLAGIDPVAEAKLGFSGVVASVILVAMLYVFSSNIIMLYARKKEFAILLSLGWRPSQLSKLLFLEATILGSMVALISWMILGTFLWTAAGSTSITRILLIGLAGLLIYWLGTLIPIRLVRRIKPYETMQSGEVSKGRRLGRSRSSIGMSLNQLVTYWPRTLLSILAIALPTSLFGFFLFVTFRLQGVLYTTWIGEFVALEVGTMHYVAMGVALLIAMLTTTEIMWQNVSERKPQLAVLKALGWQNTSIRRLVLTEGALTGFFAGLLGVTFTIVIVTIMYQQFPTSELPFLFATILIPVVTGVLGALLPAERAVRITPAEAIGGHVVNQKQVEKRFRFVLGTTATALVVGIISLFVFTSPEVKPVTEEAKATPAPTAQTTGAKQADLKADKPKEAKATTPKEDDLQKIMNLGTFQTFIGDPQMKKREFQVGEPVYASPDGTKPEDGKRFVSLPISLYNKPDQYEGTMDYRPNGFRMYTPDGTEYSPVDIVNHNKKAFRGGFIYTPGEKSEIDLVFLVPEKAKTLVLYASSSARPKVYTVKIDVP